MSLSLFRALGVGEGYDYVRTEYLEGAEKFYLAVRKEQFVCPNCGSWDICRKGKRFREVATVSIDRKPVILVAEVPRCQCLDCGKLFDLAPPLPEPLPARLTD